MNPDETPIEPSKNRNKNTKYTKQRVDIILNSLANMSSRASAAEAAGISYVTYMKWYNNMPDFKEKVDRVLEEVVERGKFIAIRCVFRAMDNNQWQAGAWWLERNFPENFSLRNKFQVDGQIDHNIKQLVINVIDDETKLLMEKMKEKITLLNKDGDIIKEIE